MADGPDPRDRREDGSPRPSGRRRRHVGARLSVLAYHEEGSGWDSGVWLGQQPGVETLAPVRDDAVQGGGAALGGEHDRASAVHGNGGGLRGGDGGDGRYGEGRDDGLLSEDEDLDRPKFADVPDGYWKTSSQGIATLADERVRHGDALLHDKLEAALNLSFDRSIEILNIALDDPDLEIRNQTGRLIIAAAGTVMQMASKVGDQKLEKDRTDALTQLIKNIQEEQKRRTIDASPNHPGI
jgi:hypothetical protein